MKEHSPATESDIVQLADPSDFEITSLCQRRYSQDVYYTRVGSSNLLVINPYKKDKICDEAVEPHPFEIASSAYLHMVRSSEDQVILTSGESGSGKSEVLKLVLQELITLSGQTDPDCSIHNEIMSANIILECFGNAETLHNDNSSRFSRYTEVKFNQDGTIVGQTIIDYLFEHKRVSECKTKEKNFHVFYLLSSLSKEEKTRFLLTDLKNFVFLKNVNTTAKSHSLESLRSAFRVMGFSKKTIADIFQVLVGILYLGNIEFTQDQQAKGYGAYAKNSTVLETAAKLLNVSSSALETALTTTTYLEDDIVCSAFLDVEKSKTARDRVASVLYQLIFKWILEQINTRLGSRYGNFTSQIGLLDLAGFENNFPDMNGFDQFSGNYLNEKLRIFFLKQTINAIPEALINDGIRLNIQVPIIDASILEMFDEQKIGIFDIINRETVRKTKKDVSIIQTLNEVHGRYSKHFVESNVDRVFQIKHYTNVVAYNVDGFIESNQNTMYADLIHLFQVTLDSNSGKKAPKNFIASLFTDSIVKAVVHPNDNNAMVSARPVAPRAPSQANLYGSRKRSGMLVSAVSLNATPNKVEEEYPLTAVSILKNSIDELLGSFENMRTWNILCIKPNTEMTPDKFDFNLVSSQIHALRVNEIAKASRVNFYSVGIEFEPFFNQFKPIIDHNLFSGEYNQESCVAFLKAHKISGIEATCGISRIFLSENLWKKLESKCDILLGDANETRRIHLVVDKLGQERTPGFIKKSVASLDNLPAKASLQDVLQAEEMEEKIQKEAQEKQKKKSRKCCSWEKKPKAPPEKMSRNRRNWVMFTWAVTFWIPDIVIEKIFKKDSASVKMAWREKVALCWIVMFLSAIMLFFVQGFGKLLCPVQSYFTPHEVSQRNDASRRSLFVSFNGGVFDISSYTHPGLSIVASGGMDISGYFPRVDPVSLTPTWPSCSNVLYPNNNFPVTNYTFDNSGLRVYDNDTNQMCYSTLPNTPGYCHDTWKMQERIKGGDVNVYQVGVLAYNYADVKEHRTFDDAWTVINGKVYNFTILYSPDNVYTINPQVFSVDYLGKPGGDASINATYMEYALDCFDHLFLIGHIDKRVGDAGCNASAYILYSVTGVLVAIMVIKFLSALQLAPTATPENHDRFVILQVPCYNEGEESLVKTIESLATLDYDDTRKLLFIVSDGMIKSAGSDTSTPDLVLQILGVDKKAQQAEAKSYLAIGRGLKEHNKAKVYSGLYSIQARYVPFIFVMKVGREGETSKPGNRGKRDSQMILMKFLNRVNFGTPMSPLELEMYHHIKNVIGVDPFLYEYVLMVDADTRVVSHSLNRLISAMVNDSLTMGICGETKIENENESWVYEYYISHHMAKAFESLFGSVTCLPGCFCMYRLRTPKKVPLLISNQILNEYKDINVNTLHKQNLLSLGEDRFLTTLMLKHFSEYRNKFTPEALCYTIVPDSFNMLLGQRRRWINSTIHNLFELVFLPTLCGCLCFSMRLIVFLDLFATLIMPASTAYLGYLIYASIQAQQAPIISLIMLGSAYGLQAMIFILKSQYQHIGWMIISILAMPVFSLYLPLYAYWHFDDFKWGNTRKGAAAEGPGGHGDGTTDEELIPLDPSVVPLITWEKYEISLEKSVIAKGESLDSAHTANGSIPVIQTTVEITSGNVIRNHTDQNTSLQPAIELQNQMDRWVVQSQEEIQEFKIWTGGYPSDEDIVKYIRHIISTSDLSQLSKKKVREATSRYFGHGLEEKKIFMNERIELIIQGRL